MSKFAARVTTTGGTTTLPACALVGGTGGRIRISEIGIFNTTTTATGVILARLSTAGTPGTAATSRLTDQGDGAAAVGTLRNTYTSTAPTTADLGIGVYLAGAVGAGVVLTYPDDTLTIDKVANSAIGLLTDTGTMPALFVYFRWYE
jgi:hypothetical protein